MVTRTKRGTGTRRRTPASRPAPTATQVRATPMDEMKARFDNAGRRARMASTAATRFARSSVREMTTAARESREPLHALWLNVRLAGRHIARDAVALWQEVMPAPAEVMKLPVARKARRQAA